MEDEIIEKDEKSENREGYLPKNTQGSNFYASTSAQDQFE